MTMSRIAGATLPAQKTRKDDHTYHPIVIEGTRILPVCRFAAAIGALAVVALAAGLFAPSGARASYILYFHTFGGWSVICWTDEISRRNGCSLTAPPPVIDLDGLHPQVTVAEPAAGAFTVTLRARGAIQPGQPAFLRVDGNPVHRTAPDRLGGAVWSGAEAAKVIDELKAGTGMLVRSFAAGSGAARDAFLSLSGFGDALTTYRDNLRTFGILRRK